MSAVKHWRWQRYTAISLFFLLPWVLFELTSLHLSGGFSSEMITQWLSDPIKGIGIFITFAISLYHGKLGIEVIAEDYVPNPTKQKLIISLCHMVIYICLGLLFFAVISIFSF